MNPTRTNDRSSRTRSRTGGAGSGGGAGRGSRIGSSAASRSTSPRRPGGSSRRPASQGEFALPETLTPALPAVEAFADLGMPEPLLAALGAQGVSVPFPIQGATLPHTLAGRDVLGRGRTGSGKTLAFGLALLARTAGQRAEPRQPLALILVPTRELAQQVTDALTPYARAVRLRLTTVVGGMPIGRQANALRGGSEVVFMPQVTALLDQVRPEGQRMLFSATLDRNVDLLVRRYLTDPVVHSVDPPTGHKDYLHRGGRTARAGESGSVVTLVTPNQRRDMTRLMTAARIVPRTTQVRPGEAALGRITGAQEPSGIPVTITAPTAGRGRRSSPARGRRSPASAIRRTAAVRQSSFDATAA